MSVAGPLEGVESCQTRYQRAEDSEISLLFICDLKVNKTFTGVYLEGGTFLPPTVHIMVHLSHGT